MLEELFHKTQDDKGKTIVVKVRLPIIDSRDAKKRCPHLYADKPDGFAAKAPPAPDWLAAMPGVVGSSGGKPAMSGGVGVVELVHSA